MSRVQLALNVSDLSEGDRVLLEAVRRRAGEGSSGLCQLRITSHP